MIEFNREELTEDPTERFLNMGKSIVVFNVKLSDKTNHLNTGSKFIYNVETYEIMNRETIDSPKNYVKFNCVRRAAPQPVLSEVA